MFQNSFQNGNYFEIFDPKSNQYLKYKHPSTKLKISSKWPIYHPIIKFSIRILKVFFSHYLSQHMSTNSTPPLLKSISQNKTKNNYISFNNFSYFKSISTQECLGACNQSSVISIKYQAFKYLDQKKNHALTY